MNINKFEKYFNWLRNNYSLIILLFLDIILIIVPFLSINNLEGFDSAGHFANAYYIKNSFWPWPDGWNMMNLSGFPQGLLYSSLFSWLGAALSYLIPLQISIKVLISLSIFFFPVSVFLIGMKIFKSKIISNVLAVFVSVFYFFETGLNDNMYSDLFYGMLPHLFSLTFFFFYILSFLRFFDDKKKWRIQACLLALCFLFHIITGVTALVFSFIFLIFSFKEKGLRGSVGKHLFLAGLLTFFWWLPFAVNLNYASGSNASSFYSPIVIFISPLILFLSVAVFFKKHRYAIFFKSVAVLNSLVLLFSLGGDFIRLEDIAIHFSRFLVYPVLLSPILLLYIIHDKKINWQIINFSSISAFIFYIFFLRIVPVGPFDTNLLEGIGEKYSGGRVIAVGSSDSLDARFHSTRMKINIDYSLPVFEGLFMESSINGWYTMSLLQNWGANMENFTWAYIDLSPPIDLSWASRIFGINYEYLISDTPPNDYRSNFLDLYQRELKKKASSTINTISEEERDLLFKLGKERLVDDMRIVSFLKGAPGFYYQSFYKVNDTSIVEALSERPVNIDKDWNNSIRKWWTSDWLKSSSNTDSKYDKPILVFNGTPYSWLLAKKNTGLEFKVLNKRMDSFSVDASVLETPAPIYVKVSYFPFWKAYRENGEELKIYKASPNFMMVYANENIIFKYIKPWYYYFAYIVSGLSLLYLILSFILKKVYLKLIK